VYTVVSQRGEGEQNPENSYSPRPLGEGLGVRVLGASAQKILIPLALWERG